MKVINSQECAKPSRDRKGEGFDISHYVRLLRGALAWRRVGIGGSTSQFGGQPDVGARCGPRHGRTSRNAAGSNRKRWARHRSTRWLWKDEDVRNALRYVID